MIHRDTTPSPPPPLMPTSSSLAVLAGTDVNILTQRHSNSSPSNQVRCRGSRSPSFPSPEDTYKASPQASSANVACSGLRVTVWSKFCHKAQVHTPALDTVPHTGATWAEGESKMQRTVNHHSSTKPAPLIDNGVGWRPDTTCSFGKTQISRAAYRT